LLGKVARWTTGKGVRLSGPTTKNQREGDGLWAKSQGGRGIKKESLFFFFSNFQSKFPKAFSNLLNPFEF